MASLDVRDGVQELRLLFDGIQTGDGGPESPDSRDEEDKGYGGQGPLMTDHAVARAFTSRSVDGVAKGPMREEPVEVLRQGGGVGIAVRRRELQALGDDRLEGMGDRWVGAADRHVEQ